MITTKKNPKISATSHSNVPEMITTKNPMDSTSATNPKELYFDLDGLGTIPNPIAFSEKTTIKNQTDSSSKQLKNQQDSIRDRKIKELNIIVLEELTKVTEIGSIKVVTPDDPLERLKYLMGSHEGFFDPYEHQMFYEKNVKSQQETVRNNQATAVLTTLKKVHSKLLYVLNLKSDGTFKVLDQEVQESVPSEIEIIDD